MAERVERSRPLRLRELRTAALARGPAPIVLGALVGIALALGFSQLGSDSIWYDEAFSVRISRLDPVSIARSAALGDTHPPLYYVLLHYWMAAFGDSEVAVRSLSVLIGALAVPVSYLVGARLADRRTGLLVAAFTALSPASVHFSQEARMYILASVLAGVSFLAFVRLLDKPTRWGAAAYAAATLLLLYTHVYGLFVLLAQALIVLIELHRRGELGLGPRLLFWAFVHGAILAAYTPWVVAIARQTGEELRGGEDANLRWLGEPGADDFLDALASFAGSNAGLAAIAVVAALSALLGRRRAAGHGRAARIGAVWLTVLFVAPFVVSVAFLPIFHSRYVIVALTAFNLLVALAISRIEARRLQIVASCAVAAALLAGTIDYHRSFVKDQWRDAARFVQARAEPGDPVLFDSSGTLRNPWAYYASRTDLAEQAVSFDPVAGLQDARAALARVGEPERAWFVLAFTDPTEGVAAELAPEYQIASLRRYSGVAVLLLERSP